MVLNYRIKLSKEFIIILCKWLFIGCFVLVIIVLFGMNIDRFNVFMDVFYVMYVYMVIFVVIELVFEF